MGSTIVHFTHSIPKHELVKTLKEETFKCKMCEFPGSGTHYSCNLCDFNLHEHCSSCPPTIRFFAHPMHELTLSELPPFNSIFSRNKHCALCSDHVHGYSYRCDPCKFNVHLSCSLMPVTVKSELHQGHELRLVYFDEGQSECSACGEGKVPCLYRCEPCGVAYQPKCIHGGKGVGQGSEDGEHWLGETIGEAIGEAVATVTEIIYDALSSD